MEWINMLWTITVISIGSAMIGSELGGFAGLGVWLIAMILFSVIINS